MVRKMRFRFGSGIAAISTPPVLALVNQGDHIVSVAKPYSWTIKLFEKLLPDLV